MAKRRLSQQQRRRIAATQKARRDKASRRAMDNIDGDDEPGVVVAHFGQQLAVRPLSGEATAEIRCHALATVEELVTGDEILWRRADETTGVITARQPRRSEIRRPDKYGNLKPVAANIDRLVVIIAPVPEPHANLIDRYLAAAEVSGIEPILVLNKDDLPLDDDQSAALTHLLHRYRQLGYQTLRLSAEGESRDSLSDLTALLQDLNSVMVGQSGVGKSSLIQRLLPGEDLRIGALSEVGKGTHTTTTARMYALPEGGQMIDSPGIREFGLWHMSADELARGFVDIAPLVERCRFRNCSHRNEPGCALDEAVADGRLSPQRLQSFRHILQEMGQQGERNSRRPTS